MKKLTVSFLILASVGFCQEPGNAVRFSGSGFEALYLRVMRPPLPESIVQSWRDPGAWLIHVENKSGADCYGVEVTTKLSDDATEVTMTTYQPSPKWFTMLLYSRARPTSSTIKCLTKISEEKLN